MLKKAVSFLLLEIRKMSNPLKVVLVSTFFHPVTGGVESQVKEIAEALSEDGFDVKVFASNSNRNGTKIAEKTSKVGNISIYRFNTWFSLSKFHKVFPGILVALFKADFDVVHVHGIRKPEFYFALLVCKIRKKKIVLTTHNPFTADGFRQSGLTQILRWHDKTIGRWFTKYADKIIYITASEKEILESRFGIINASRLIHIPNGINKLYFEPSKLDRQEVLEGIPQLREKWDGVVLAACRMNEVKGLQNLEIAIKSLPKVLFIFAGGDDGYLGKLKGMYRNYPNVVFTEKYIKSEMLRSLMDFADVFVLPSLHEPFGLTIVEAAAAGLPVIATNVGGPKEILDDTFALFLDPTDQMGWAKQIKLFVSNKQMRKEKSEAGKIFVQKFRWENVIKQLENVYYSSPENLEKDFDM